jgi:hypothetical protein
LPENERLEAVQYCMLLLDDENRDAVQCLLYFLHDISLSSHIHKMDVRNISTCLAPSLLNMNNLKDINMQALTNTNNNSSPNSNSQPTSPISIMFNKDPTHLMTRQCNASLNCLSLMIENPKTIFQIPNEAYAKCQFTKIDHSITLTLNELLGSYSSSMLNLYLNDRIDEMIKEVKDKPKNWNRLRNDSCVDVHYKCIEDDEYNLRLWKLSVEIESSASDLLNKLMKFRSNWDDDLIDSRVVEVLDNRTDVIQYVVHFMAPQPSRDFCELRTWREGSYLNPKYSYIIYSTSIEHEKANVIGDIRANTLRNFYLIETISEKKCKIYQIYRADYKGYSSEWYNKIQGHLLKRNLLNLKDYINNNSSSCLKNK